MDPDDLKDAISRGTATPEQQLVHFLKTETFYLILVVLVLAMAAPRLVESFRDAAVVLGLKSDQTSLIASDSGPELLQQKQLQENEANWMKAARRSDPRAAEFATGVRKLNGFLGWCGWAALLALAVWWALPGNAAQAPSPEQDSQAGTAAPPKSPGWGLWDVAKLAALFAIGSHILHYYIFPLNPAQPFEDRGDWIAEIFARILLVGALLHIVVAERGGRLRDLGFRGNFVGNVLIAVLVFLAIQPLMHLVGAWEEQFSRATVQETLQAMLNTKLAGVLWLGTAVAVCISPIAEELFFRSFLQPALQQSLGRWTGILACAAFFAAAHRDPYALLPLLILGLALGVAYDRTRSLAVPVIVHAAYNGLTLLALFADRGLKEAASHALR